VQGLAEVDGCQAEDAVDPFHQEDLEATGSQVAQALSILSRNNVLKQLNHQISASVLQTEDETNFRKQARRYRNSPRSQI
jgi:hypothetical protein